MEEARQAQEDGADPKDLTMAISRLDRNFRTRDTAIWIGRQPFDRNIQPEVARALAKASTFVNLEVFAPDEIFKPRRKMGHAGEQVPLLMDIVDREHFGVQTVPRCSHSATGFSVAWPDPDLLPRPEQDRKRSKRAFGSWS